MQNIRKVLKFIDSLNEWSGKIFSYLFLALLVVVLVEVVARSFFNSPTNWVFETSLYLFAITVALGAGYTFLHKDFVSVDIFHNKLSPRGKAIVDVVTFIFILIFIGVLLWKGWDMSLKAIASGEKSQSQWAPVVWPLIITIPIGSVLLLLQSLSKLVKDIFTIAGKEI